MKTDQFFDERSREWSGLYAHDARFARRFERITRFFDQILPQPAGRALDAGCGSGVFSRYLASIGWRVEAFDASRDMIEEARVASFGFSVDYVVRTIEDFTPQPESMGAIISLSMLEYVEDDDMALGKFARALKSGGVLVVSVPNRPGLMRKFEGLIFGIRSATKDRLFSKRGDYLTFQKHQYSAFELDLVLRQHGFRKIRHIYLNAGIARPAWLLPILERRWWAALYCAAYRKM